MNFGLRPRRMRYIFSSSLICSSRYLCLVPVKYFQFLDMSGFVFANALLERIVVGSSDFIYLSDGRYD
jgi:hypothetical protein